MDVTQQCQLFSDTIKKFYQNNRVSLHEPVFVGNEKKYVLDCIDSTFVSYVGENADKFEKSIAEYTGAKFAISTINGTSALHAALIVAGVKANDEVITQALSFVATANAISYCHAYPSFIDVDIDTMGMSPEALRQFLKKHTETKNNNLINKKTGRRIQAVLPMHTFGIPCRINEIRKICTEYGLALIEDSAEALGSHSGGTHVGTLGNLGIFSFNANKIITSGGGGMIITDDEVMANALMHLTKTSKRPHAYEFFHDEVGYNYRLPNLNASLGLAQFEQLEEFLKIKSELAEKWKKFFKEMDIKVLSCLKGDVTNNWLIPIQLSSLKERNMFLEHTNNEGVMTRPIWKLIVDLPMYKDCYADRLTNSKFFEETIVSIPSGIPRHMQIKRES